MTATFNDRSPWNVSPSADRHSAFEWQGGVFETARREHTASVEGVIRSPRHLVMTTLRGGARRHEFVTDCGYRYEGRDRPGFVSFLPAGCERRLRLRDVAWEWASIALQPDAFSSIAKWSEIRPFSDANDGFLHGMLSQFHGLLATDGKLDVTYCDAMSLALVEYIKRRSAGGTDDDRSPARLPSRQLRIVQDYVEANLANEIRIPELALLLDLSEGHFHRAFRAATGRTPLQFVNECRVGRAAKMLAERPASVLDVALEVGFVSPSHFARVFRGVMGVNPARYRRDP